MSLVNVSEIVSTSFWRCCQGSRHEIRRLIFQPKRKLLILTFVFVLLFLEKLKYLLG